MEVRTMGRKKPSGSTEANASRGATSRRSLDELVEAGQTHAERGELADAEACYRAALRLAPDHPGLMTLLGVVLVEAGTIDGAIDILERARELAPQFAPLQLALGSAYAGAGHDELAVRAMEVAAKLDTESTVPFERLAKHHIVWRRPREAIGVLRRLLRRSPSHAHARFLLAGLTSERPDEGSALAPPPELIADLFDTYAPSFDEHLVRELQYNVPRSLTSLIASTGLLPSDARVLDLGCGTGLAGIELRPRARTLIGSDLSPRMIVRARERGIYDALHVEDLTATLAREREIDLVVAADVFIYVGPLETTFAGCAVALQPGGLLAFSVERGASADVVLQPTLRYAHTDAYVRRIAGEHGFSLVTTAPTVLRLDADQPVQGDLYVFRR
jgi:predicted TPR repeat methyltransferase